MHTHGRYPRRVRQFGGLLLAAAISLIVAGMGMGHGLILAVGLVLAPFGLHLLTGGPAPQRKVVAILPNYATDLEVLGKSPKPPEFARQNGRRLYENDRYRTEQHRPIATRHRSSCACADTDPHDRHNGKEFFDANVLIRITR